MKKSITKEYWEENLSEEVNFWKSWFIFPEFSPDFKNRMNLSRPFRQDIEEEIACNPSTTITLLEIGCGPATMLGHVTKSNKNILVTHCDPLADEYLEMWKQRNITPPHPIINVLGEELTSYFSNQFDITFASNCLDHSIQAVKCIEEMLKITKSGGIAILEHGVRESDRQNGKGLHQWNFWAENDKFYVSHLREEPVDIGALFSNIVKIEVIANKRIYVGTDLVPIVYVRFRKL